MKRVVSIIFAVALLGMCCSENPLTQLSPDENSQEVASLEKRVKPPKPDPEPTDSDFVVSVQSSASGYQADLDYYGGEVVPFVKNYLSAPAGLSSSQFVSFSIDATSVTGRDWFTVILFAFFEDFDYNGIPDSDHCPMMLSYKIANTKDITEYYANNLFYWWGQVRVDFYPATMRMLLPEECGRYLIRVLLRQEIETKTGKHNISKGVYMSSEDPNFSYGGVQGYFPIVVNVSP